MIVNDIVSEIVGAVSDLTPETDSTAPPAFMPLAAGTIEESGQDRNFELVGFSTEDREWTGVPGYAERTLRCTVRVKAINEGRAEWEHRMRLMQDAQRLQDYVVTRVRLVAGVGAFDSDGNASIEQDGLEPSIFYVNVPFVCEYTDAVVTA